MAVLFCVKKSPRITRSMPKTSVRENLDPKNRNDITPVTTGITLENAPVFVTPICFKTDIYRIKDNTEGKSAKKRIDKINSIFNILLLTLPASKIKNRGKNRAVPTIF